MDLFATKEISYIFALTNSGCSVARLSRLLWEQEAAGSNPATPTKKIENFKKIKVRSSAKLSIPILIGTVSRETFLKTSGA